MITCGTENVWPKFFVRRGEANKKLIEKRKFYTNRSFISNQTLDKTHFPLLEPFFDEVDFDLVDQVKCIYTSDYTKSYLVKFRAGSEIWNGPIVVKGFLKKKKKQCEIETQNIRWVSSLNARLSNTVVQIPEIVWSKPTAGLFATRWIPGNDMDLVIKKASRLWTRKSPCPYIQDFGALAEWLKSLSNGGQNEINRSQALKEIHAFWERFFVWLYETEKFEHSWRVKIVARLEDERKWFDDDKFLPGPYHDDFTPCNVRRDLTGHFWVLDWRWLGIGHWLEAAYQFSYALRKYSYSPLSRWGYFKSIYTSLEEYLHHLEPDEGAHRYYRLCMIMRNLFVHGRRPTRNPRSKFRLHYWMRELTQLII